MGKVAIYARVSTHDKQDYNRQINELTNVIINNNYSKEDIDIYAETLSGYKKKTERPRYAAMLRKIEDSPSYYDCIYVTELTRLGRDPSETRITIDMLTDLKIPVYINSFALKTIDKKGNRDGITNIIIQVLLELGNNEAETFKIRSKSGLLQSAKAGKAGGGRNLPYGYAKDNKKILIIDELEAEVIKEIFNLYKAGYGIRVISNVLNERHVPTRYNKAYVGRTLKFSIEKHAEVIQWSDKQIHDMLRNTIYKGERKYKGEIIVAPAIISVELFDECQSIMSGKTHRNYMTSYIYLLKDLLICGCCGRNYFARYKPAKGGDKVYICSSRLKKGAGCKNIGVNISLIESAIYNEIVLSDVILKYLQDTRSIKKNLNADISRLSTNLKVEEKLAVSKENEKNRLLDVYIDSGISKTMFLNRQNKIDSELTQLNEKIALLRFDLSQKKSALAKQNDIRTTKEMIISARDNRNELQTIYKQFISRILINSIDESIMLATVYLSINSVELKNPLKLILDLAGLRRRPLVYRYYAIAHLINYPVYKNNILQVDVSDIKQEVISLINVNDWIEIEADNILSIK